MKKQNFCSLKYFISDLTITLNSSHELDLSDFNNNSECFSLDIPHKSDLQEEFRMIVNHIDNLLSAVVAKCKTFCSNYCLMFIYVCSILLLVFAVVRFDINEVALKSHYCIIVLR